VVDQVTRTNCKKCRFRKCLKVSFSLFVYKVNFFVFLQIGMKPGKVDVSRGRGNASQTFDKKRKSSTESTPYMPTKYPVNEIQSSEPSNEQEHILTNLYIEILAEECVLEESNLVDNFISRNNANQDFTSFCSLSISEPVVDFTLEEEFRVYELEAMKENLFDGCFKIFLGFPNFLENISKARTSLNQGESCGFSRE
jgi:hypothetical protein